MTLALSGEQRTELSGLVQSARRWIEEDLAEGLEGRFGIHASGRVEAEAPRGLTAAGLAVRSDLVEILEFLRFEGEDAAGSVERLVREAAFTHVNRLVAVRVAEAVGLLPATIGRGVASTGFRDFSELAPTVATTEWGRFAVFVRLCADELAADVPALFNPRNPLLELELSESVLRRVVEAMAAVDDEIWAAPDTLGWAYQFFNTSEERKEMREASTAPRDSRELAVRNQFFTPSYVVDFLVHNGLGAHLAAGFPQLADDLPLLVEAPTERINVDLEHVSVLDPACGSGHFLLGAYDVLERAWMLAGVDPGEAALRIVRSLWGIDIDPRACQIAQAAVVFRARRHCRGALPPPNVICARALPSGAGIDELIDALPTHVSRVVRAIAEDLVDAPVLGPLLKIEDRLDREVRDFFGTGQVEGTLAESASQETRSVESQVLAALRQIADSAVSTPAQRLFAAEAQDAVRFVEAMTHRYTAVLTNPPYGLCAPETETYLRNAYQSEWTELYATFVTRSMELASDSVGALTSSMFMVSGRLRAFRKSIASSLVALVDLGSGVLQGATVDTVMWTLRIGHGGTCAYSDVRHIEEKSGRIRQQAAGGMRQVDVVSLVDLPGSPFAFHVPTSVIDLWAGGRTLEPSIAIVRTGGNTYDNFRYLRAWWELSEDAGERGWLPYEKGGDYQPYVAPTVLRVNWKGNGKELRAYGEALGRLPQVMQSNAHWGTEGICYPRVSSIGFAARIMPQGEIFGEKSIAVLPEDSAKALSILGLLNSTVAAELLTVFGRGRSTEGRAVKALPVDPSWIDEGHLAQIVAELVDSYVRLEESRETSVFFTGELDALCLEWAEAEATKVRDLQTQVDTAVSELFGVESRLDHSVTARPELNARLFIGEAERRSVHNLTSYVFGLVMGRWRAPRGAKPDNALVDLMSFPLVPDPLTATSRDQSGRILVDQAGHPNDVTQLFESTASEVLSEQQAALIRDEARRTGLRGYLRTKLFPLHLKRYSSSGRKAPIYWPLQVPSRKWGLWLYAPRMSREMLFGVVRESEQRQRLADQQIARLQREAEIGGGGRSASDVAKELDAEQSLAVELATFQVEAERIANLGWEPDLDDGMVLNAAPLADLFPAWKDAAKYREELRAGKYEWATVAQYADRL